MVLHCTSRVRPIECKRACWEYNCWNNLSRQLQDMYIIALLCINCLFQIATSAPVDTSNSSVCMSADTLLGEISKIVDNSSPGIRHLGEIPAYAATSCQQIATLRPRDSSSGYYWIQDTTRPVRVYCQMNGSAFQEDGVWMKIADVNTTETSSVCPSGLERVSSPKPLCRKTVDSGCSSVTFATHAVPYTKVCGQVIGMQYYSPNAFFPYYSAQTRTIDDLYVDGVSITHSHNPRQHIWTFAAALDEVPAHNRDSCPCANSRSHVAYTGLIPEFIGNDYYCETGSRTTHQVRYYPEDPLWDGEGCGRFSTCCEDKRTARRPWFCKDVGEPVSSDVEVRLCADGSRANDEDILLEIIQLYVQ